MTTTRKQTRSSKRPAKPAARTRLARAWNVLRDAESVRWTRVQAAQARIASGFYEREEVQCAVVSAVIRELRRN